MRKGCILCVTLSIRLRMSCRSLPDLEGDDRKGYNNLIWGGHRKNCGSWTHRTASMGAATLGGGSSTSALLYESSFVMLRAWIQKNVAVADTPDRSWSGCSGALAAWQRLVPETDASLASAVAFPSPHYLRRTSTQTKSRRHVGALITPKEPSKPAASHDNPFRHALRRL